MKPQELSNEELIAKCRWIRVSSGSDLHHMMELLSRFERITLGQVADDAAKKAEELMQPTLQVGWEYKDGDLDWVWIVDHNKQDNKFLSNDGEEYLHDGNCCSTDLPKFILSTGRPVSKPQPSQDEVEELSREIYVRSNTATPKQSFKAAEEFITYRNERRAGK